MTPSWFKLPLRTLPCCYLTPLACEMLGQVDHIAKRGKKEETFETAIIFSTKNYPGSLQDALTALKVGVWNFGAVG